MTKITHNILSIFIMFTSIPASAVSFKKALLSLYVPTIVVISNAGYLRSEVNNSLDIIDQNSRYDDMDDDNWNFHEDSYDSFLRVEESLDEDEYDDEYDGDRHRILGLIPKYKGCDDEWEAILTDAKEFLKNETQYLLNYDNFGRSTRVGKKMIHRRLKQAIKKLKIKCHGDNNFCEGTTKGFSRGRLSFLTKRIHFCTENWSYLGKCHIVSTMAHEIGHMIGMRVKRKKHNDSNNSERFQDRVYQFGYYAKDRCYDLKNKALG